MQNMTKGNPLKLILWFSLPLLLGNLLQQTYSLADTAIVGRFLSADALAAVGATASVQFLVLGFCNGSCTGICIPIARDFGAGDLHSVRRSIYNGIWLMSAVALVMTGVCTLLTDRILDILNTPANIYADTRVYIFIIFLGIPFMLLYNFSAGILRSIGDSKTPFLFLAISALLNIGLDIFCIIVLKSGVAGAAIATVISQGISGVLSAAFIAARYEILHFTPDEKHVDPALIRSLALVGFPMGLQFSITAIGSMVMQSANNALGSIYVSAMTASARIKQFAMCPFDAIGTAVSTFASQNDGAGKARRTSEGLSIGLALGISYGLFIGMVLIFFGRTLALLFVSSGETEILDAAGELLAWAGICFTVLAVLNISRPTLQSMGFTSRAMTAGFLEMTARSLICLFLVPRYGFSAICVADEAAWIAAAVFVFLSVHMEIGRAVEKSDDKVRPFFDRMGLTIPRQRTGMKVLAHLR